MNRQIDLLISTLERMFAHLNACPLDGNQFHVVRTAEVEFQNFLSAYRNPNIWISQDGQPNKIENLADSHLSNIIALLDRQVADPSAKFQDYEIERYGNLQKEQFRRLAKRLSITGG